MSPLLHILVGFALLLSLAVGGVAHAAEDACVPSVEATAIGHLDGDSDQSSHGDEGYAHHHGSCHGHHNVAPVESAALVPVISAGSDAIAIEAAIGPSAPPAASLRPPIA